SRRQTGPGHHVDGVAIVRSASHNHLVFRGRIAESSRMAHSDREVHDPLVVDRDELTPPPCAIATLSPYGEEACWRFVFVGCNHRAEPVAVRLLRLQGCAGQSLPLAAEGETAPRAAAP